LAYSSWMVKTRTDSSSADAFSSMALDFFLPAAVAAATPLPVVLVDPDVLDRPGRIGRILGSGMMISLSPYYSINISHLDYYTSFIAMVIPPFRYSSAGDVVVDG
jgi:hypothetical protein